MARESKAQKETIERVMHEFKEGELTTRGRKVKNPKQAIAIALSEADVPAKPGTARAKKSTAKAGKAPAARQAKPAAAKAPPAKSAKPAAAKPAAAKPGTKAASPKRATAKSAAPAAASARPAGTRRRSARGEAGGKTRVELYAEAKRRNIPGRSRMDKAQLEQALRG